VRWDAPIRTTTLTVLLDEAAARFGPLPALEFRGRQISYAALHAAVERFAAGLMGLERGARVALLLPNTPWHPVALFGVLRAGLVAVMLSPLDAPRTLVHKLADSGAGVLVATHRMVLDAALRLLDEGRVGTLLVGEDEAWGDETGALPVPEVAGVVRVGTATPPAEWPAVTAADLALLQYTGGTTGEPRAAMLTHGNLTAAVAMANAWGAAERPPLGPGARVLGVLPLFHIFGLTSVLMRSLTCGAEILLRTRFDAARTADDIEAGRVTHFAGVPTMWTALASLPGVETRDFSSLRGAFSGGAPLDAGVAERLRKLTGIRLGVGWGMTETSPAGMRIPPGMRYRPGLVGVPLPGIEVRVVALDDPARVLPAGEVGELAIRGANVTAGYWNRPEENERAFAGGFLLTGDVGRMEDGLFFLLERKKDMIISGGFNVYPRVIEEAIGEHPDVVEAAVIGIADAYRGEAGKAFVVLRDGAPVLSLEALRGFLADRLGRHELPAALEIRGHLPRTAVGKLARRLLVEEEQ
jgi:long-chain acyl-CoA synthetase